jgi:HEAT repeat protein
LPFAGKSVGKGGAAGKRIVPLRSKLILRPANYGLSYRIDRKGSIPLPALADLNPGPEMTTADDTLPALIADTHHHNPSIRLGALRSITKLGALARNALPDLTTALNDSDPRVREGAAQAIGQLGRDAIPVLVRMLSHSDKYIRRNAVWGLGKLGSQAKGVIFDLCRSLKDEDARTASGAAQAIGNMGEDAATAVPNLAEAMRGTNIVLCRLAAKALSQIGRPALSTLIVHLKHHDPFICGEAAVALGWMGPKAASAVSHLIDILRKVKPKSGQAVAQDLLGHPTPVTPIAPVNGTTGEQSPEEAARASVITALGRIGPDAITALPYLQDALHDPSDPVRRAAEIAIRLVQGVE